MRRKEVKSKNLSLLIDIEGMKCGGCVRSVEKLLSDQPNVQQASVNLVTGTAWIDFKSSSSEEVIEKILLLLSERGFPSKQRREKDFSKRSSANKSGDQSWWSQWKQLMVALILVVLSILGHLSEIGKINLPLIGTLPFHATLATYAVFGPGLQILKRGAKSAINLSPTMDSLVGLGVSSAYAASLVALIWPNVSWPCFFNEPVMLLGFVLVGRFLEERARFRTNKALQDLAQLQPENARLFVSENEIREVKVGSLKPGENIQLLAGDRIPVDGIVKHGNSSVDVSSLTGEPMPINASKGTELASGSLNLEGTLIFQVQRIGAESSLARIVGLVEEAQARKAPIQGLVDQVAGNFCYLVLILSLSTFIFWWQIGTKIWPNVLNASGQGLMHQHGLHTALGSQAQTPIGLALQLAIAVLVVACPCALGLATPTVITVSSGLAAKHGWLFKGGDVIETASSITQIIFDKTGTLTIGRPLVVQCLRCENELEMLQIAGSLEQNSRHPIAYAILQKTEQLNLELLNTTNTITTPGMGIKGEIENFEGIIRVGKPEWLKEHGVIFDEDIEIVLDQINNQGNSIVAVSLQEKLLGLICIDDRIRADANTAIARLRKLGLQLDILSGDRQKSVLQLGEKLGFEAKHLGWQLLPEEKLEKIKFFQSLNKVGMVGDGINDAPALAAADIGIAVGTGTQIAKDSADLVLLGDRLEALPEALLLAKKTMGKIRQNLFWAFGYNMLALPLAAGALLPSFGILLSPPLAAFLMATSSITVVMNALSLKSK